MTTVLAIEVAGVVLGRYAGLFQWLLHFVQTVLLLVTGLALVYPACTHTHNVAHERGVYLLAAGFLLLSVRWATEFVPVPELVPAITGLLAAVSLGLGSWEFARSFVDRTERFSTFDGSLGEDPWGAGDD